MRTRKLDLEPKRFTPRSGECYKKQQTFNHNEISPHIIVDVISYLDIFFNKFRLQNILLR